MIQNRVTKEEETSAEEFVSTVGTSVGGMFLFNDCCGRAQLTVDGAIPGQVVLGYIKKVG